MGPVRVVTATTGPTASFSAVLLAVVLIASACTGGSDSDDASEIDSAVDDQSASAASTSTTQTTAAPESTTTLASSSSSDTPPPGRPSLVLGTDENDGVWLGHGVMSDESIELVWAGPEDVSDFEIYRIERTNGDNPDQLAMEDAVLIYQGDETGLLDTGVVTGERYWYVLQVDLPDGTTSGRWTEADAVTDDQPPSAVTGLTATRSGLEVTLKWDQTTDNYLFGRYAIRRSVDGEQSVYYGTGFTLEQTSFIDDQLPRSGTVTYQVIATDFHDNQAEPAVVSIELG